MPSLVTICIYVNWDAMRGNNLYFAAFWLHSRFHRHLIKLVSAKWSKTSKTTKDGMGSWWRFSKMKWNVFWVWFGRKRLETKKLKQFLFSIFEWTLSKKFKKVFLANVKRMKIRIAVLTAILKFSLMDKNYQSQVFQWIRMFGNSLTS